MILSTLPVLSLVALSAAQSSTVSLFLPFADPQSLVASIAGSDSTATSYIVKCASPAASTTAAAAGATATGFDGEFGSDDGCGFPQAFTVVQGPSTLHYVMTIPDVGAETVDCQLTGSTQAICTAAASGPALTAGSDSIPPLETATLSSTDISFMPVVITAGSAGAKQTGSSSMSMTGSVTAKTVASTGTGSTKNTRTSSATDGASTGASSSAKAQGANAGTQGTPGLGAGFLGVLGVAVAGALL